MTYPTVGGDIKMKNRHVGVNFDDRDIPAKQLPEETVVEEGPTEATDVEGLVKSLQRKNVRYNKEYYNSVLRKNPRAISKDEIEDPRSLTDIEQENVDLKEQFIH